MWRWPTRNTRNATGRHTRGDAMKRPSFQFYPGDWLRSTDLRSCSIGARGLWMDMICLMHEGNPYGHLKVNQKVILAENLSRMVGETFADVDGWLAELRSAGVLSITEDGCMFSRRMVKDENTRNNRAAGGKSGGNPALLAVRAAKENGAGRLTTKVNLEITPALASTSPSASAELNQKPSAAEAPAKKTPAAKGERLSVDWSLPDDWKPDAIAAGVPVGAVDLEGRKFRDYWVAKTGKDATKLDWQATWRNWCRNAVSRTYRPAQGKPSKHDLSQMDYSKGVTPDGRF